MTTTDDIIEFTKKEQTMDEALNTLRKALELYSQNDRYEVIDYSINKIFDNETFYKVKIILSDNSKKKEPSRILSL